MTRVCLVGDPDCNLQYELLSRETSREALATYDLRRPFENSIAVRTVSVGAAVSLLNDLQWYIVRFVDEALVQEPSVSEDEWLSRQLARDLRNGDIEPEETGEFCKVYGLEPVGLETTEPGDAPGGGSSGDGPAGRSTDENADGADASDRGGNPGDGSAADAVPAAGRSGPTHRLVEPLYVRRTGGELPEYDLRDVDDTLVVRITESEYT